MIFNHPCATLLIRNCLSLYRSSGMQPSSYICAPKARSATGPKILPTKKTCLDRHSLPSIAR